MTPNGLANLRQVSGAKVAVASFVIETARRQAQRFVSQHDHTVSRVSSDQHVHNSVEIRRQI